MEKNSISLLIRKGRLETCLNGKTPYFPCFYISKKKKTEFIVLRTIPYQTEFYRENNLVYI